MFASKHVSKFRHLSGKPRKREQCFDQLKLRVQGSDPPIFAVSGKYLAAIATSSNADIVVRSLDQPGRVGVEAFGIKGPNTMPQCLAWSNRDDSLLAVGFANGQIGLYRIPEGGPTETITDPEMLFDASCGTGLGVLDIVWHPTVAHLILVNVGSKFGGASDTVLALWNVEVSSDAAAVAPSAPVAAIQLSACFLVCVSFNYDGSRVVTTDNNFLTSVINLRSGQVLQQAKCHEKNRRQSSIYLKDGLIFTVGFNSNGRVYAVWSENDLTTPLTLNDLDNATGVLYPIYDPDLNLVYIWGKGDSTIFFVEITPQANGPPFMHYLNDYQTKVPQKGVCHLPKRHVDIHSNEVMRFFKSESSKDFIEVIPFVCPRREPGFSTTVYPPTASVQPALSQADWLAGGDADPILVSMNDGSVSPPNIAIAPASGTTTATTAGVTLASVKPVVVKATVTPLSNAASTLSSTDSPLFKKYEKDSKTLQEVRLIVEKFKEDQKDAPSATSNNNIKELELVNRLCIVLGIQTMRDAIASGDAKKAAGSLEKCGLMQAMDKYLEGRSNSVDETDANNGVSKEEDEADWET